jgi:type II secretory pathway pseudopilin PulG
MRRIVKRTACRGVRIVNAFALIEILIVAGILGPLALLGSQIGRTTILRARDIQRKDDLARVRIAIDDAYDTLGYYPPKLPECGLPFREGNLVFSERIPCDPKLDVPYIYVTDGTDQSRWYKLYTNLEYTKDSDIDYVGCRTGCGPNCQYNYGIASTNIEVMGCSELVPPPIIILSPTPVEIPTNTVTLTPTPIESGPTSTPLHTHAPTHSPSPAPVPILYACAPGGGQEGACEQYDDPERSECPKAYPDDPTCQNECAKKVNKCRDASGKHKPE